MKCKDIMSKNLEVLSEKDSIARAAALMAEAGIGFLPVCDAHRKAIGVVTDRDLVTRGLAKRVDADSTSAALVMTSPALTIRLDADLRLAEELMAAERKARLIVTNVDGTVAGVVSIADVIEHAPNREALKTLRAVLWREALGPRGGAEPGARLLKDQPRGPEMAEADLPHTRDSVFGGGHRDVGTKEFPS
jgi:CBS domain-containing protein